MFKNYFKIAWRNLLRNKVYSFINIAGLSLGLACAMLIILYVKDEVSFDRFHVNAGNIYRIVTQSTNVQNKSKGGQKDSNTGYMQGPHFTAAVPAIKGFVRIQESYNDVKSGTDVNSQETFFVDSSFFSVFSFPLLSGNDKTCLRQPKSAVVSEEYAKKQYGTSDAVGKLIMIKENDEFVPYKITAVAKNTPQLKAGS